MHCFSMSLGLVRPSIGWSDSSYLAFFGVGNSVEPFRDVRELLEGFAAGQRDQRCENTYVSLGYVILCDEILL